MSQLLTNKLAAVRRKRAMVTTLTGAIIAVGVIALLIGLTLVFDWWLELPRWVRAGLLLVEFAILAYVVVWQIVLPIIYGPDDEELALAVERETPDFRSRLISVIQLVRPEASAGGMSLSMVGQLIRETEAMAEPIDFARVIKVDRVASLGTVTAVIVIGLGLGVALTAPASVALVQRAMLMNVAVPRKTIVEAITKDIYIPRGESVTISAKASGLIIPAGGSVQLKFPSGQTQTFEMPKDDGTKDQYSRVIDNVQEDFSYVVKLNDGHGEEYKCSAAVRPSVQAVDCQQTFPKYAGGQTVKRQTGDLAVLEGSRLLLDITANKKIKPTAASEKDHNSLHLHGSEVDFPLTVVGNDATKLSVKDAGQPGIPLPKGTTGFSVHLVDELGLTSKNPAIYPITLVPDQAPRITINSSKRNDELVTAMANVDIGYDASDDYGIQTAQLRYRILDPDGTVASSVGDGLKATYFRGADFKNKAFDRIDGGVNFDWNSRIGPDPSMNRYSMSAQWVGQLQPAVSGDFTFFLESTAKVQFWLDDKLVLDTGGQAGPVTLKAFQRYDVKITYGTRGTLLPVVWSWQGPGIPKQAIPKECLFTVPLEDKTALIASSGVPEKVIPLQVATGKSVRGYYPWKISDIADNLPLGTVIQWRLQVTDNNDITGPGISYSDPLRQLRLVSESDKRKELMDRMGDQFTTLQDITEQQRQSRDQTAKLVTGGGSTEPSLDLPDQKPPGK